jgi:hypothetical protein
LNLSAESVESLLGGYISPVEPSLFDVVFVSVRFVYNLPVFSVYQAFHAKPNLPGLFGFSCKAESTRFIWLFMREKPNLLGLFGFSCAKSRIYSVYLAFHA